ncbi:hypothetical protein [Halarcobacter sp.]|uniref:hypothetical protein n=1 Tax=Halarcobacter sp. TaxID=2321133 RepID=UPI0029F4D4DC|nr:hypothetical protein [Halarcobacter sp.]
MLNKCLIKNFGHVLLSSCIFIALVTSINALIIILKQQEELKNLREDRKLLIKDINYLQDKLKSLGYDVIWK